MGWFEESFIKFLPKTGKIIEAGCGLGYYVLALERRGYDVEGVEWIRLLYTYPLNFPYEVLDVINDRDNICKRSYMGTGKD